ncbi:intracellular multiplication protein IcmL [Roseateles asaccharophilus]|uniref:type IVB secretion system apparatus protein IcmL/DotI n=1 Tax=Roseateles asaccharophilus TaxID=582607 RepID=UPI003838D63F
MASTPTKPLKTKPTGALERVAMRYEFYRDNFRTLATATPILVIALLVSVVLNFVLATRKPRVEYFAVDPAGRIVPIRSLNEPYVTDAYLNRWVAETVARAYSMDPQNYRRQVQDLQEYFTPEGYESYVQSLQSSETISFMTRNLLVMSAIPMGTPIVAGRGEVNGIYFWKVQIPMLVDFRSGTKTAQKKRLIEVTVVRRQTIEAPAGIGISQFVATDV